MRSLRRALLCTLTAWRRGDSPTDAARSQVELHEDAKQWVGWVKLTPRQLPQGTALGRGRGRPKTPGELPCSLRQVEQEEAHHWVLDLLSGQDGARRDRYALSQLVRRPSLHFGT